MVIDMGGWVASAYMRGVPYVNVPTTLIGLFLGIPPEEAQFLETRQFQVAEIARLYRVPPHLIGDAEPATQAVSMAALPDIAAHLGVLGHLRRGDPVPDERLVDEGFLDGHAAGERAMRGKAIAEIDNYPDINLEDAARLKNNIYALPLEAADKEKK